MKIYFTETFDKQPLYKCPHNTTDENNRLVYVGSEQCKRCEYCTHYEIDHSLVPKGMGDAVDDWYVQSFDAGMKQFNYQTVGFVNCKHGILDKGSVKLLWHKLLYNIKKVLYHEK